MIDEQLNAKMQVAPDFVYNILSEIIHLLSISIVYASNQIWYQYFSSLVCCSLWEEIMQYQTFIFEKKMFQIFFVDAFK